MVEAVPRRAVAQEDLVAHTPRTESDEWHSFADHARTVGDLAAEFAEPFGASDLLRLIGYTHDAGKATVEVQEALRRCHVTGASKLGVTHKGEGAALAWLLQNEGKPLAVMSMCLANYGHHSGMPDYASGWPKVALMEMQGDPTRLDALVDVLDKQLPIPVRELATRIELPAYLSGDYSLHSVRRRHELFTRMCHSALVDADFLDTSAHFNADPSPRRHRTVGMEVLRTHFLASHAEMYGAVASTPLNNLRRDFFEAARAAGVASKPGGERAAGIYRLPAPTGYGKTMAAAGFALEHAAVFAKRRVVVAVPYTSITTQNAQEYRSMFAGLSDSVVLEHHSNIASDAVADDTWRRLSAANWDAEFVVTTTVQLFESLFSNRPAATHKLHRLADSVLVIDEVQALPLKVLPAILTMLRDLSECFGVTVLLASATQPAFWDLEVWKDVEYVDVVDADEVPELTQRVTYECRSRAQEGEEVAAELAAEPQVLAIVNTTSDAQRLHSLVLEASQDATPVLHLSTRMCGLHRLDVLNEVRALLRAGQPVRLISTQVVEAGVDIDFPVVYRALAPADSIVQSAGRCNREGRLGVRGGKVVVFEPVNGGMPGKVYASMSEQTRHLFVVGKRDFSRPQDMSFYYSEVYSTQVNAGNVGDQVNVCRAALAFEDVAQLFHMIEPNGQVPVVVTSYGSPDVRSSVEDMLQRMPRDAAFVPSRQERRLLQQATVNIPAKAASPGAVTEVIPGTLRWEGEYDELRGCLFDGVSDAAWIL